MTSTNESTYFSYESVDYDITGQSNHQTTNSANNKDEKLFVNQASEKKISEMKFFRGDQAVEKRSARSATDNLHGRGSSSENWTSGGSIERYSCKSATLPRKLKIKTLKDKTRNRLNETFPPDTSSLMTSSTQKSAGPISTVEDHVRNCKSATLPRKGGIPQQAAKFRSFKTKNFRRKSLPKYDEKVKATSDNDEVLSSGEDSMPPAANIPGILRIYGGSLDKGTNYKSLLASSSTSASNLLETALKRFNVPLSEFHKFVLCEVQVKRSNKANLSKSINFNEKEFAQGDKISSRNGFMYDELTGEAIRVINKDEIPLKIQSNWFSNKSARRQFEIRRKSELVEKNLKTSNFNQNLITVNSTNTSKQTVGFNLSSTNLAESKSFLCGKLNNSDRRCSFVELTSSLTNNQSLYFASSINTELIDGLSKHDASISTKSEERTISESNFDVSNNPDANSRLTASFPSLPYLVTLQGNQDVLIHSLKSPEILIGGEATDFSLIGPDVQNRHCLLKRNLEVIFSEDSDLGELKHWWVTIYPLSDEAEVRIDGTKIKSAHLLQNGETISIGEHHSFMYKDPHYHTQPHSVRKIILQIKSTRIKKELEHSLKENKSLSVTSVPSISFKTRLHYSLENEEHVLKQIYSSFREWGKFPEKPTLAPATLIAHCLFHSSLNFGSTHTSSLIDNVVEFLKKSAMKVTRKTKEGKQSENVGTTHPLLEALKPISYWMMNALELLNFLRNSLDKGLIEKDYLSKMETVKVEESTIIELKEVVATTFKKIVYNVTRVLYEHLSALFDCNPFAQAEPRTDAMCVIDVLTHTREMLLSFSVNSMIFEQLISYLFYFMNIYLFNTLMDEATGEKCYNWEWGVRIRGNLEKIENLATQWGYSRQFEKHFQKLSALSNLLATPKHQLVKNSWKILRLNFPALSAAQLNRVLTFYQLSKSESRSFIWSPPSDEDIDSSQVLEGHKKLPPFVIPEVSTNIKLNSLPKDSFTQDIINHTNHPEKLKTVQDKSELSREDNDVLKDKTENQEIDSQSYLPNSGETNDKIKNKTEEKILQPGLRENDIKSLNKKQKPSNFQNDFTPTSDCNKFSNTPQGYLPASPNEVLVVQIDKDNQGLGVGFVDGLVTSLSSEGVYVRFLIPEGLSDKEVDIKHHDLVRCWPRDGRLQLGDRILAVNGTSVVNMDYEKAMKILENADNNVRLLVGRCGHMAAMKILLPNKDCITRKYPPFNL